MAGHGSTGKSSSRSVQRMSSTSSTLMTSVTCPTYDTDTEVDLLETDYRETDRETDYRRRCRQLEESLVKFKEKATRIRQLLSIKVSNWLYWSLTICSRFLSLYSFTCNLCYSNLTKATTATFLLFCWCHVKTGLTM